MCLSLSLNSETMLPDDFITVEDTEKVPTSTAWSFSSFTVAIGMVVVRLVVRERKHTTARGVWGHASQEMYGM